MGDLTPHLDLGKEGGKGSSQQGLRSPLHTGGSLVVTATPIRVARPEVPNGLGAAKRPAGSQAPGRVRDQGDWGAGGQLT